MSAEILPLRGHTGPLQVQDWRQKLEHWCARLEECVHKPSRRHVHSLRAATLRLQAELDACLQSGTVSLAVARAAQRWSRKAKRARKLLSPVRDTDVCLELLETFCGPGADAAKAESPDARDYLHAIERLKCAIRRRRETAGKRMILVLEAQHSRIVAAARELGQALATSGAASFDNRVALQTLVKELAAAASNLTPAALHGFRKLAKTGRYLAEHVPLPDARTQELALQCKAIQTAIGQWRDWTALSEYAQEKASHRAGRILVAQLSETATRLLGEALVQCQQAATALADPAHAKPVRRPVQSIHGSSARRLA